MTRTRRLNDGVASLLKKQRCLFRLRFSSGSRLCSRTGARALAFALGAIDDCRTCRLSEGSVSRGYIATVSLSINEYNETSASLLSVRGYLVCTEFVRFYERTRYICSSILRARNDRTLERIFQIITMKKKHALLSLALSPIVNAPIQTKRKVQARNCGADKNSGLNAASWRARARAITAN